ncbi:MAG TPA: hypothetical protein VEM41_10450 [Actinomycetota bacterium]|nr:hypothetical protein [Actinomycetota bacterium]
MDDAGGRALDKEGRHLKWRLLGIATLLLIGIAVLVGWIVHASTVTHWLEVHTGTVNEPGPYYGFWSGFGSDIAEFGVIGVIGTGVYQLVKKYNCHEPGCWRVGNHPAAGGQFVLCYRHHPDFKGKRPTHELIERLHRENVQRQEVLQERLHAIHEHLTNPNAEGSTVPPDPSS